jgi:hypothetical protein
MRSFRAAAAVSLAMSVVACAGNGSGLDSNGQVIDAGGAPGSSPLSADFDSIQANIFTPICSVCHIGGGAPQGLRLDAANSYNLLVGVPSTEIPSTVRVAPGDPDSSYIIQKLEGHAAVGARMPLGGPYLSADTIAFIRQWITNGALPSAAAQASAALSSLAITSRAPELTDFVSESPPQIMIGFNRELNVTRIDADSVRIERLTGDLGMPQNESLPARLSVSPANPRALMVWPSSKLTLGRYRVVMHGITGAEDSVVSTFEVETLP